MLALDAFNAALARVVTARDKLNGEVDRSNNELVKAQGVIDNAAGFLADPQRVIVEQQCQAQIDIDTTRLVRLANSLEAIPALAP